MEGGQTALEFNPYAEDPRPNLFNIIKNTRENKVGGPMNKCLESLHATVVRC